MKRAWLVLWLSVLASPAGVVHAQLAQAPLDQLFSHEVDVFSARAGLVRVELSQEVLRECKPDLADLRAFDADGKTLPYVAVRGADAATTVRALPLRAASVLEAERARLDDGAAPDTMKEVYELATPDSLAPLVLHLRVTLASFTRLASLTFLDEQGVTTPLARSTTLFRTPNAGEKLSLPLGVLSKGRVRVEISGQGPYLNPRFEWEGQPVADRPPSLSVALETREQRALEDRTLLVVSRPVGILASSLTLGTRSTSFERQVHVFDADPNRRLGELGSARIQRADALTDSMLDIPLRPARGDRFEIEIIDRDSPALDALQVIANVERPTLVFEAPASSDSRPSAVLRFGGGRARAPQYDLEALLAQHLTGAEGARKLAALPSARLGVVRDNPRFAAAAPLYTTLHAGAVLDVSSYANRRRIEVPASREGVFSIALTADDLAALRPDLSDVRIIDSARRQRPYVLAHDAKARDVTLAGPTVTHDALAKTSTYVFDMPAVPLAAEGLTLSIDASHFERSFELRARDTQDQRHVLASGRLSRRIEAVGAADVELSFARTPVAKLELIVENGDDSPLQVASARAKLGMPTLYFAAPPGTYALLLGCPQAGAPQYDLTSVRDALLAVASRPLVPDAMEDNREDRASSTLALFQRPGGTVETRQYGWLRECSIGSSRDGLARITLAPEDLAVMRADFGDVRVVDAERRQRPYLLHEDGKPTWVDLQVPAPESQDGRSTWKLSLPAKPNVVTELVVTTEVPFFDRSYRVVGRDADDKEVELGSGRLSRRAGSATTEIKLELTRMRVSSLELVVTDGEDAPLALASIRVRIPLPTLYVLAPAGEYVMLLGSPKAQAPSYEIGRERDLVLSVQSEEARIGPLRANPTHGVRARVDEVATQEVVMWVAFGFALIALTSLTFRLVRREER